MAQRSTVFSRHTAKLAAPLLLSFIHCGTPPTAEPSTPPVTAHGTTVSASFKPRAARACEITTESHGSIGGSASAGLVCN